MIHCLLAGAVAINEYNCQAWLRTRPAMQCAKDKTGFEGRTHRPHHLGHIRFVRLLGRQRHGKSEGWPERLQICVRWIRPSQRRRLRRAGRQTLHNPKAGSLAGPGSEAAQYACRHARTRAVLCRTKRSARSMQVVSERPIESFARASIKIAKQMGGAKERGRLRGDAHIARMPSLSPRQICTRSIQTGPRPEPALCEVRSKLFSRRRDFRRPRCVCLRCKFANLRLYRLMQKRYELNMN